MPVVFRPGRLSQRGTRTFAEHEQRVEALESISRWGTDSAAERTRDDPSGTIPAS